MKIGDAAGLATSPSVWSGSRADPAVYVVGWALVGRAEVNSPSSGRPPIDHDRRRERVVDADHPDCPMSCCDRRWCRDAPRALELRGAQGRAVTASTARTAAATVSGSAWVRIVASSKSRTAPASSSFQVALTLEFLGVHDLGGELHRLFLAFACADGRHGAWNVLVFSRCGHALDKPAR